MRLFLMYCLSALMVAIYPHSATAESIRVGGACGIPVGDASPRYKIAAKIAACTKILNSSASTSTDRRAQILRERGRAYHAARKTDLAIADYTAAIELTPDESQLYALRGIAWPRKSGNRAFNDYSKALELNPNDWMALQYRGRIYVSRGKFKEALADYTALVLNDPYKLQNERSGYLNFILGRYAKAENEFSQLESSIIQKPHLALWLYLAQTRSGHKKPLEALRINAAALKSSKWPISVIYSFLETPPTKFSRNRKQRCEWQFYLGQWYLLKGEADSARSALKVAARICPGYRIQPKIWFKVAALADYNRVEQILQTLHDARKQLSQRNINRERDFQAKLENYDRILAGDIGTSAAFRAQTLAKRARDHLDNGSFDLAISDLTTAIKYDPYADHFHKRCGAYALKGDLDNAIGDCSTAIRLNRGHKNAYRRRGAIRLVQANYESAVKDFEFWTRIELKNTQAMAWLYLAQRRLGDDKAAEILRQNMARLKLDMKRNTVPGMLLSNSIQRRKLAGTDACGADFYIGQSHMLRGRAKLAQIAMEKAATITCSQQRDEYLVARADLARLDAVVNELVTRDNRRRYEAQRRSQENRDRIVNFTRHLKTHRQRLGQNGAPFFEFNYTNGAWGYVNHGCLIGGKGDVFMYDVRLAETVQLSHRVNAREYQETLDRIKNLTDKAIVYPPIGVIDAGSGRWSVSRRQGVKTLKTYGESAGELKDSTARQLVESINKWCPAAARAAVSAKNFEQMLKRQFGTQSSKQAQ